jgi:REP element-mobilizing transposase RayT
MSSTQPRVFYHITTQPHRRLPALYGEIESFVRGLVIEIAQGTEFSVLEVGVVPTHIHLLIEKAPWADLLAFLGPIASGQMAVFTTSGILKKA